MTPKIIKLLSISVIYFQIFSVSASEVMIHDHSDMHMKSTDQGYEKFSTATQGFPSAKKSEIVKLKDGDSYTLEASIVKQKIGSKTIRRFAYNGLIPGPTFEVEQGSKVKINFINKTDHDQTIHPHGLRLDYHSDGIPGISQKSAVKPDESFTYEFTFPDVGLFWYHPHVREDYTQQMGLYGNFLVRPKQKDFYEPVNKELILTLDDILLGKDVEHFYKGFTNYAAMGRYGNVMLLNNDPKYSTQVNKGDVVRFFITNTANTRTFNFKIQNAKIKVISGDDSKFEHEFFSDGIIIAPGERIIADIVFEKSGKQKILNSIPGKDITLGYINVLNSLPKSNLTGQFYTIHKDETVMSEVDKLKKYKDMPADKNLKLAVKIKMMNHDTNMSHEYSKIEWEDSMPEMNAMMTSNEVTWKLIDTDTKKENMDIDWELKKDSYYKIKIFNDPKSEHPMQHPIHFHGQRFLILTQNGVLNSNFVWKDTALISAGDTVELLMEASNVGKWMGHCHISEHLSSGMMMKFCVVE